MANNASNRAVRNVKSAGYSAAKITGDVASKSAVSVFKWAATDHSSLNKSLSRMDPNMGFMEGLGFILGQFIISVFGALIAAGLMFLLIAYGIPLLLRGIF